MPEDTKQLPVRLSLELYEQLQFVAKTAKSSMNKVVQQALREYLPAESARLADELSPRIAKLRAYAADPGNRAKTWQASLRAELEHAAHDPAEGTVVRKDSEADGDPVEETRGDAELG